MSNVIYTATGCARCNITKKYMRENSIEYEEFDIKAEGKDAFSKFYREHRSDIFRDKDGVEFPVFTDGQVVRQGVSVVLGHLVAEDKLQGFIGRSELHGEWLDGIDVSGGDPDKVDDLIKVLSSLKKNGLKIQAVTSGKNSTVLESLVTAGLVDRVIMNVKGPVGLYPLLAGEPVIEEDIRRSIQLTCNVPEHNFISVITPVARTADNIDFITPEEIGETAKLIAEASGSKKCAYTLSSFDSGKCADERFATIEPLPTTSLFKYRTAARRYQVMTEIEK